MAEEAKTEEVAEEVPAAAEEPKDTEALEEVADPFEEGTPSEHMTAMIQEMFANADKNKDGMISREELEAVMKQLGEWEPDDFDRLFKEADANEDGSLQYGEFVKWVMS
eukprot:gnl/MRDRNA2_/MRDRNA2_34550_c0_seq2.p2 gnl/MRDRNA2_/MRDRNA2_34550_c0~~gnl/MRDRNA2_/MRDRNA2_34550_c0_seq2.p2  ORF type:complete len:109 (+),score=43.59 gnl/MRDRNA2_/MRDRNA2_34550_c0_seq2:96-422(+)